MPKHDDNHVILDDGIIVWDGINQPNQPKEPGGKLQHNVKCVFPPNHPDVALFNDLAQKCLQESKFNGVLPNGGLMPITTASQSDFEGMFPGWSVISFKTTRGAPSMVDESNELISNPMTWGPMIYTGQKISVLAHCYDYDQKSRGVAGGLSGIMIAISQNAQRIQIGGPSIDAAQAFSNRQQGGGNQNQNQNNNYQNDNQQNNNGGGGNQNQNQNNNYQNDNQQNNNGGGGNQNQNQNNNHPNDNQQNNNQQNGGGNQNQNQNQNQQNGGGYPNQATNFMPNNNNNNNNGG